MWKDGKTVGEIAEEIDGHTRTITNWLHCMLENGDLDKGPKPRRGLPPKVPKTFKNYTTRLWPWSHT